MYLKQDRNEVYSLKHEVKRMYLLERPFSSKDFKVTFNHAKLNLTLQSHTPQIILNPLQSILIAIHHPFRVEFHPERQVLFPNLFRSSSLQFRII